MTEIEKHALYENYASFWPFYLSQHKHRTARLMHVIGTLLALFALLMAITHVSLFWLILAPFFGYGFAWIAHLFFEKNHPATFTYPLWSLLGDFHMLTLWLTGRLEEELLRHKILT